MNAIKRQTRALTRILVGFFNKRIVYSLTKAILLFLPLTSCVNYDDVTQSARLQVTVVKPAEFINGGNVQGQTVTVTRNGNNQTAITDAQGIATFDNLVPDIYTVSTSWELSQVDYNTYTGDNNVAASYTISGSIANQKIFDDTNVSLVTNVAANRDIIIGKIYHSGSKDKNNRTYQAGKYIELYNQSDSTVNVAGLYIALLESGSTQAWTLANLHERFADSVVVAKQVFRIPTTNAVNIAPGGTVLLVNSAVDHTANSDFENDLSGADFEAKDVRANTKNNPDVPALEVIYTSQAAISMMNLVQGGPCGVVIFRTTEDVKQWKKTYQYGRTSGTEWLLIPIRYVIDGVDLLKNRATGVDTATKRLYPAIDGGYTNSESISGGTGEVVYRKTLKTVNGKKLLQDTNNSTNDFKASTSIKIRNYDE